MIKKVKTPAKKRAAFGALSSQEYVQTLADIKSRVQEAQSKSILAVNKELIKLYWEIGHIVAEKQEHCGWGASVIERLVKDLQGAFPGIEGFSRANVFRMRAFYRAYEKVSQAVILFDALPFFMIPWGHNVVLLIKLKDNGERLWYAYKAIEYGWSRSMLEAWIASDLYRREGRAITNFKHTLPAPQSDMAQQSLKDPYIFDFLTLQAAHVELEVEQGLIDHIQKFLLELGQGFAFIGRQVHLHVGEKDYYIDLLFYHVKLRCYVVIELKAREFDPRDAGQINFYLAAVDDTLKHEDDEPTIGLLLCTSKDRVTVEYALRGNKSPIGVASYETKLVESLPKNLKNTLPTVEEIEAELEKHTVASKQRARAKKKSHKL